MHRSFTANRWALFFLLIPMFIYGLVGCGSSAPDNESGPQTFEEMMKLFRHPPTEYRTAPLWVWNDDMTEKQILEQLTDFNDKGIGGVFVHPRPGLITPYLSKRWHAFFSYATQVAKKMEMHVWIYDENSYPSGFAGGHVPAEMPESWNQGQGLNMIRQDTLKLDPDLSYEVVLIQQGGAFKNITGDHMDHLGKAGDYYLFEKVYYQPSAWHGGYTYVDLLVPGVAEKFIDITMKGYEATSAGDFGHTVPGIFTDEPNINAPGQIRWTPDLFEEFSRRWKYDLRQHLPPLLMETGDFRKVRYHYYSLLLDLFIERWSLPWYDYTRKNDLKWTGHYWEHGWPDPSEGPDNMAMYAWHQLPGIDILMNQYRETVNAQFGNARAVKEVRSVANQMGRRRTLSETYGAGGWDLTFEDMKRIADWQYVLGINFINQHLSYVTIKGARKRDHPQSFSYHEPWWKHYRVLADYCARLSVALSSGEQKNSILVLEPTTTAWMYYAPGNLNKKFGVLASGFQDLINTLEENQVEYDLGSEAIINRFGSVEDGLLTVGMRQYSKLLIPDGMENMDARTFGLLQRFVETGGTILSTGPPPRYLGGVETDVIQRLAGSQSEQWKVFQSYFSPDILTELSSPGMIISISGSGRGKLFHHRREFEDGQLVFLVNSSKDEWARGTIRFSNGTAEQLNPMDGTCIPYPHRHNDGMDALDFQIPPVGELLLFIHEEKGLEEGKWPDHIEAHIIGSDVPRVIKRHAPNALILDYCDLEFDTGTSHEGIYFFDAADHIFRHYGLNGNPWSRAVQYENSIVDTKIPHPDQGFRVFFHFQMDPALDGQSLYAVIERPELWEVSVNGLPVVPEPDTFYLDASFGLYALKRGVQPGWNTIQLHVSEMTMHTELEPIYILGEFSLVPQAKGWMLGPAQPLDMQPWSHQGMPFYSQSVSYMQSFHVPEKASQSRYVLYVPDWKGSVASVSVNGKQAGIIGWNPYELEVTPYITEGRNKITLTVFGTLKNLLGPHHFDPAPGAAWPVQFESAPPWQPAGLSYNVFDYGLMDTMKLVEISGPVQKYFIPHYKVSNPMMHFGSHLVQKKPIAVTVSCSTPGATVRYALDGDPVDITASVFPDTLYIDRTTRLSVKAYSGNMIPSETMKQDFFEVIIGQVDYLAPYSQKYAAAGELALIDRRMGSASFNDGRWQGFEENDMEVILELTEPQFINSVSVRFLQDIGSWIFYPEDVYLEYSTDGINFQHFATASVKDAEEMDALPVKEIRIQSDRVRMRHLKVRATNVGRCPEGTPGAGGKAWLFVDEITIH